MKTAEFIAKYKACESGSKWAISVSDDMADVWDALIKEELLDWLLWVVNRPGIFPNKAVISLTCRFIREIPLSDGRKLWDLLTDPHSRKAVETAERFVWGEATEYELGSSADDARSSLYATLYTTHTPYPNFAAAKAAYAIATTDTAYACAYIVRAIDSTVYDTRVAACSAQVRMIAELVNPFKENKGEK